MPACLRRAGKSISAFPQQDGRYTAHPGGEIQFAARHHVERARVAGHFQQQHAGMLASKNVMRRRQRFGRIGCPYKKEALGIAAQLGPALGRERAIFQRLVIGPYPEDRFTSSMRRVARQPDGQAGGEAAGPPIACENLMQRPALKPATQGRIRPRHTQRQSGPVRRQAVARYIMAQFLDFFLFVHVMF